MTAKNTKTATEATTKTPVEITYDIAAHWRLRVEVLTAAIATAARTLAEADAERRAVAVDAAGGSAAAMTRLAELRQLKVETENGLDDQRLALAEAGERLQESEALHARAVRDALLATARGIADRRIAAARRFDEAGRAMAAALDEWQATGVALLDMSLPMFCVGSGMATRSAITGYERLEVSFPEKVARRVFPASSSIFPGAASLAESEANLWIALPAV